MLLVGATTSGIRGHPQEDDTDHEAQHRPLHVAEGVRVHGRRTDLTSQSGVGLVELLLDFAEDALLVFGKRHGFEIPFARTT